MDEHAWLAERFEANRVHLRSVAYRMLGSMTDADDAVQESWLRFSRAGANGVENLGGWLTTIVAHVCLDMLRSRKSRHEELFADEPAVGREAADPADEVVLADSVGLAMLVVLETLDPAERVAFVLHDMFDLPFDQIAPIVRRTPAAARQLASRARRRVRGAASTSEAGLSRRREVVEAFLAASRGGDFAALLALLDPNVVLRSDAAAVESGAAGEVRGAREVAGTFAGRARAAQPALIDGEPGLVWAARGRPRVVFNFKITAGKILEINLVADPDRLRELDLKIG
jgi:RNA polymerase sigma factor (sigma-70 family)